MTIYAIVNSMVRHAENEGQTPLSWTVISSSAILQGGNPYFVPDFAERFEARTALAVRIGKLGKGIAPRFASRYIDSIAPCVLLMASDLLVRLRQEGLPWTQAISYDRCLAIGKFVPAPDSGPDRCRAGLTLLCEKSDTETRSGSSSTYPGIEETISTLSRDNTLKTGDIILTGIAGNGPVVSPGLKAILTLDGEVSLKFNIR